MRTHDKNIDLGLSLSLYARHMHQKISMISHCGDIEVRTIVCFASLKV